MIVKWIVLGMTPDGKIVGSKGGYQKAVPMTEIARRFDGPKEAQERWALVTRDWPHIAWAVYQTDDPDMPVQLGNHGETALVQFYAKQPA